MRPHSRQLSASTAILAATLLSCGSVHFVKSPYAVRKLAITYSVQEDLTIFAWELGAGIDPDAVTFEVTQAGVWTPIVFEKAPFPAGPFDCPGATCYRWAMRGRYEPPLDFKAMRSQHVIHGLIAGPAVFVDERPSTLAFSPRFSPTNDTLNLRVEDFYAPEGSTLRRHFAWLAEATDRTCLPGRGAFDDTTDGTEALAFREAPSAVGRYCVELSPEAQDDGLVVRLAGVALTHPLLFPRTYAYAPPEERAPIVYKILIDLEIPNEQRCADAIARIIDAAHLVDEGGPSAVVLEPLVLSDSNGSRCRQDPTRQFDSAALAGEARSTIEHRVTERFGAPVVFMYFNNLALTLPAQLIENFGELKAALAFEPRTEAVLFGMGTPSVLASLPWDVPIGWTNPSSKAFREIFTTFLDERLPIRTMVHDDATRLSFIEDDLDNRPGGLVKVCSSTPPVVLTQGGVPTNQQILPYLPGEQVQLAVHYDEQLRFPADRWKENTLELKYEVCTRWCAHPFMLHDGTEVGTWDADARCRGAAQ